VGELRVDVGRNAVAEHIPLGGMVLREIQALVRAEAGPDALGVGTQLVDDDCRVRIALVKHCAMMGYQRDQLVES
jgi:hypothetical protein